jgi:hypothetical protein
MPAGFMESDTLLMTLKNLMRQAYDREQRGEPHPIPAPAPPPPDAKPQAAAKRAAPAKKKDDETLPHPQIENLKTLRDQGILTEQQFQDAKKRLLAKA